MPNELRGRNLATVAKALNDLGRLSDEGLRSSLVALAEAAELTDELRKHGLAIIRLHVDPEDVPEGGS